jgi:glycosidase
VYEVYLRSFADSDGDGIGGIGGIGGLRRRLPYLADLGVDALWITLWYPSPMADGGYDVAGRARAAVLPTMALPGSAYLHQGEELGLPEVEDLPEEALQDPTWERSGRTARGRDRCPCRGTATARRTASGPRCTCAGACRASSAPP